MSTSTSTGPSDLSTSTRPESTAPLSLDTALARRAELLARPDTDAVRLLHGRADGAPGVTVDRLGPALLIERHVQGAAAEPLVGALASRFGVDTPIFLKERWSREREPRAGRQVFGPELDPDIEVREDGLRYRVRLAHEEHVGLFLDAREARRVVRAQAAGRRVLNLFAYTCSLGVAAAAGGARSTTNVDAMRSALALGQENYGRNGLPSDSRSFLRNDVFQHLARAVRGRGRYDLVILDPPPPRPAPRRRPLRSPRGPAWPAPARRGAARRGRPAPARPQPARSQRRAPLHPRP